MVRTSWRQRGQKPDLSGVAFSTLPALSSFCSLFPTAIYVSSRLERRTWQGCAPGYGGLITRWTTIGSASRSVTTTVPGEVKPLK